MCNIRVDVHYVDGDMGVLTRSFVFKNRIKVADYIRDRIGWDHVYKVDIKNTSDEAHKLLAVLD